MRVGEGARERRGERERGAGERGREGEEEKRIPLSPLSPAPPRPLFLKERAYVQRIRFDLLQRDHSDQPRPADAWVDVAHADDSVADLRLCRQYLCAQYQNGGLQSG